MKLYIGEKEVSFTEEELLSMYVDEGREGIVYQYGELALKVYKDFCIKDRLDIHMTKRLSMIPTKRILLPQETVYDEEHNFKGYVTSFLSSVPLKQIEKMKMVSFVENLKLFGEDCTTLGKNQINIDDLIRDNLLFMGSAIYLTDPGSFLASSTNCEKENQHQLNEMILRHLLVPISYQNDSVKKTKQMIRTFEEHELYQEGSFTQFIQETMDDKETVKQYVKRGNAATWNI